MAAPTVKLTNIPPVEILQALSRADPCLGAAIDAIGLYEIPLETATSTFAALTKAVVFQQITARAASSIYGRLEATIGLSPEAVLEAGEAGLRSAGLSRAKAAAIAGLAAAGRAGQLPVLAALETMTDAEIGSRLRRFRGVGPWTVDMLLLFWLARADVFPAGDLAIRRGLARLRGLDGVSPQEAAAHAERWRPYRSVAALYLWRLNGDGWQALG